MIQVKFHRSEKMIRARIYVRSCLTFICLICGIKPVFLTHRHCSRKEDRLYWQAACKILDSFVCICLDKSDKVTLMGVSWLCLWPTRFPVNLSVLFCLF